MKDNRYPKEFMDKLKSVKGKRPQTVIRLLLEKGTVTTEDLAEAGYEHAPRAVRDVRELGIPIITDRTTGASGKSVASYRFGDPKDMQNVLSKTNGRTVVLDKLRDKLVKAHGSICSIYLETLPERELQVDHRIPYEIGGEGDLNDIDAFMLLSPSANRKKSWECEHCENWTKKDVKMCETCFWAYPEHYQHIAGKEERIAITRFSGDDAEKYDKLVLSEGKGGAAEYIKDAVRGYDKK